MINSNSETSEILSVYNINLFFEACHRYLEDLDSKYYFDPEILFIHNEIKELSNLGFLSRELETIIFNVLGVNNWFGCCNIGYFPKK